VPASEPMSRRAALETLGNAVAVPLAGIPMVGQAQPGTDWPSQPVRYINPFPPGGATDTLSRLWCAKMSDITGQQFVVENRSGSGGNVGVDVVAKSRPDGTTPHLSGELLKQLAGVEILHVPYRGGAPALLDLMAGRVHLIMDNIPGYLPSVRDGKIRALAITGPQRSPVVPDLPTMSEVLPGFEITSWTCVCGPAGLPRPVVERLSAFARRALESPDLVHSYQDLGATPWWTTPEQIQAFRAQEEARLAPLIRATGARVE
jgi:tripartite-type tricarboxylate transporter receptor subunit TctC